LDFNNSICIKCEQRELSRARIQAPGQDRIAGVFDLVQAGLAGGTSLLETNFATIYRLCEGNTQHIFGKTKLLAIQ
jgi:hypothetical protein